MLNAEAGSGAELIEPGLPGHGATTAKPDSRQPPDGSTALVRRTLATRFWPEGARPLVASGRKGLLGLTDQVLVSGTRFATAVLIGRLCGPAELGVYSLGFALCMFFIAVQESLVLTPYTVYASRLAGDSRRAYAGSTLLQHAVLAGLAMLGLLAVGYVLPGGGKLAPLAPVMWVLVAVIPFALLREFCRRVSYAHLDARGAMLLDLAVAVVQVGGIALLAAAGWLSVGTAYVLLGVASATAGLAWLFHRRKEFLLRGAHLMAEVKRNWTLGKWVFAASMTSMLYGYWLYWLLALAIDAEAAGIFAACQAVVALSNPLILGVGNVLAPGAAHAFADRDHARLRRVIATTALLVVVAMVLFCMVVALFGNMLLVILYGQAYSGHGLLASTLAMAMLISAAGMPAALGLYAMERAKMDFLGNLTGLAVMALVTAPLILSWGTLGVACGLLGGNAAMTATKWYVFLRATGQPELAEAHS